MSPPFSYVIGALDSDRMVIRTKINAEHMEEDDEISKALPEWVELEYSVSIVYFPTSFRTS
jgi:hypothetical protein